MTVPPPLEPAEPLSAVGEELLLAALRAIAREAAAPLVAADRAGDADDDDAAVWVPTAGSATVASIDALVEGVDFHRHWLSFDELGARAFAVAASDMAAMGASSRHCLVTICTAGEERVGVILDLQRGLCRAAAAAGCRVSGGDVSATGGAMVIDVCIVGELPVGSAMRRAAGQPGDALVVTGMVGRAAAGLHLLRSGTEPVDGVEREWVRAQLQPQPRLREGTTLRELGVRCAGDLSDGLLLDARRTARASGCAAELWLESLPVDERLRTRFSHQWLELAVGGGEDFELLAAVPADLLEPLLRSWAGDQAPLTVVGRLLQGAGVSLLERRGGATLPLPTTAASHFR